MENNEILVNENQNTKVRKNTIYSIVMFILTCIAFVAFILFVVAVDIDFMLDISHATGEGFEGLGILIIISNGLILLPTHVVLGGVSIGALSVSKKKEKELVLPRISVIANFVMAGLVVVLFAISYLVLLLAAA